MNTKFIAMAWEQALCDTTGLRTFQQSLIVMSRCMVSRGSRPFRFKGFWYKGYFLRFPLSPSFGIGDLAALFRAGFFTRYILFLCITVRDEIDPAVSFFFLTGFG